MTLLSASATAPVIPRLLNSSGVAIAPPLCVTAVACAKSTDPVPGAVADTSAPSVMMPPASSEMPDAVLVIDAPACCVSAPPARMPTWPSALTAARRMTAPAGLSSVSPPPVTPMACDTVSVDTESDSAKPPPDTTKVPSAPIALLLAVSPTAPVMLPARLAPRLLNTAPVVIDPAFCTTPVACSMFSDPAPAVGVVTSSPSVIAPPADSAIALALLVIGAPVCWVSAPPAETLIRPSTTSGADSTTAPLLLSVRPPPVTPTFCATVSVGAASVRAKPPPDTAKVPSVATLLPPLVRLMGPVMWPLLNSEGAAIAPPGCVTDDACTRLTEALAIRLSPRVIAPPAVKAMKPPAPCAVIGAPAATVIAPPAVMEMEPAALVNAWLTRMLPLVACIVRSWPSVSVKLALTTMFWSAIRWMSPLKLCSVAGEMIASGSAPPTVSTPGGLNAAAPPLSMVMLPGSSVSAPARPRAAPTSTPPSSASP